MDWSTETEASSYLGYPLDITAQGVTVRDDRGQKLATLASFAAARRFIRALRKAINGKATVAA